MAEVESRAVMGRYFDELWNKGNLAVGDELFSPQFICHMPDGTSVDRAAYLQVVMRSRSALPDLQVSVDELIAEGDRIAARFVLRGTQQGEWQGLPPSGKPVRILSICTYRVVRNQIVEKWLLVDQLGMLRQLGAFPTPAQARA